jgi:hypothetical protein
LFISLIPLLLTPFQIPILFLFPFSLEVVIYAIYIKLCCHFGMTGYILLPFGEQLKL